MPLARAFGTTPEFWMNAQRNLDVWMGYKGVQSWREVEQIYFPEKELGKV